jgi:hypothetical protein
MKNVLGEMNLLLFSSRTMPISKKKILGNFLLKDFIYYFFYIILPLSLANLVISSSPLNLLLISVTYSLTFFLGISITFFLTVVYRLVDEIMFVVSIAIVLISLYMAGFGLADLPTLGFYLTASAGQAIISIVSIGFLLFSGVLLFEKETLEKVKTRSNLFENFSRKFDSLTSKNLVDIGRSTGGFGKIGFSFLVIFVFLWFFLTKFPFGNLFLKSPLLSLGVLVGISSVSIYNWLNRYDSIERYLYLPVDERKLLKSKIRSYFVLGPLSLLIIDIVGFLVFEATFLEFLHALISSLVVSVYILSVVVYLSGLKPNTELLNASTFIKFVLMSSIVMVPMLIVSIFYTDFVSLANTLLFVFYLLGISLSSYMLRRKVY